MRVAPSWSILWLTLASAPWKSQGDPVAQPAAQWKHPGVLALERAGDFEGDILRPRDNAADRNAVTKKDRLWPGGIIPYVIDAQLNRTTKKILRAMADIESKSCLRFVARRKHENYLHIMRGDGCSSHVGRKGGAQQVSLGRDCLYQGIIVHELTHAVGFAHEHSRSDRDQYIDVFTENAEPENVDQFKKLEPWQNKLLTPFDRDSVMLYGSESFSRKRGLATMLAKDGSRLKEVHEKPGLSASDARRINMLYRCKNKKT
ncbi:astacin-like metalloprotease toxin 5 [Dermacentor variabilis]|uniref:astacin-like metalloprotease toxin 5 n=1 Tax=Dermacentor variabilis TaxID=34621 RepID=UPI003F5B0168